MKVSRKSWHYKFINAMEFYPEQCSTRPSYIFRFIQSTIFLTFGFGWTIYLLRKIKIKHEPVEFIDNDDDDEK